MPDIGFWKFTGREEILLTNWFGYFEARAKDKRMQAKRSRKISGRVSIFFKIGVDFNTLYTSPWKR